MTSLIIYPPSYDAITLYVNNGTIIAMIGFDHIKRKYYVPKITADYAYYVRILFDEKILKQAKKHIEEDPDINLFWLYVTICSRRKIIFSKRPDLNIFLPKPNLNKQMKIFLTELFQDKIYSPHKGEN